MRRCGSGRRLRPAPCKRQRPSWTYPLDIALERQKSPEKRWPQQLLVGGTYESISKRSAKTDAVSGHARYRLQLLHSDTLLHAGRTQSRRYTWPDQE